MLAAALFMLHHSLRFGDMVLKLCFALNKMEYQLR
jgi:hypothetical protein